MRNRTGAPIVPLANQSAREAWNHNVQGEGILNQRVSFNEAWYYSIGLRARLSARGCFITVGPRSMLRHAHQAHPLKELHVDLPLRPWLVAILTLKNRTLSPVVGRFIACAREVAKRFAKAADPERSAGH